MSNPKTVRITITTTRDKADYLASCIGVGNENDDANIHHAGFALAVEDELRKAVKQIDDGHADGVNCQVFEISELSPRAPDIIDTIALEGAGD